MTTTTDLSKFGWHEKRMAAELLTAACTGLPSDFYDDEITIMLNTNSGNVFLTNSKYQAVMMNGNKLESFYSCPICGHGGFLEEIDHNPDDEECQEWIQEVKTND